MPRSLVQRALLATVVIAVVACGSTAGAPTAPNTTPTAASSTPAAASASASSAIIHRSPAPKPGTATPPADWPTPVVLVPASPLPSPAGSALPADLIGREYVGAPIVTDGIQAEVLTLRAANDPHCAAMYGGKSTCFTILWTPNFPNHVSDPAVRGSARIVDGKLVLGWALVPNDPQCEGTSSSYAISADGWILDGVNVSPCSYQKFVRL